MSLLFIYFITGILYLLISNFQFIPLPLSFSELICLYWLWNKPLDKSKKIFFLKDIIAVFSSVQSLSHVQLFATPWTTARQASLSIANSNSGPLSQWYHPTISSTVIPPPTLNPPGIGVFSNESVLRIRWPKYWSFSFSISPSSEYSGLISFRMDWLDLLAVQGTLKSLLQHHSSKTSIL